MYQSYDWNFLSLKNELINKKKSVCVCGGGVYLYIHISSFSFTLVPLLHPVNFYSESQCAYVCVRV